MKETSMAKEARRQYSQAVAAFRRYIPDPSLRMKFSSQIDGYVRQCVLGVWQADGGGLVTDRHVAFYEAICSAGSQPESTLLFELSSMVAGYDLFAPPPFFDDFLQYDRLHGTDLAPRFIDQLTLILLTFAAVDGVVSEEEAGFINACADTLTDICRKEGKKGASVNARDFITPVRPGESGGETATPVRQEEQGKRPGEAAVPPQQGQKSPEETAHEPPKLEDMMAELDALCGLDRVKKDVKSLVNLVKVRKLREKAGLPVPALSLHLVFLGNPGTGKTTVARLLAKIYQAIGVLSRGQLVEADRSTLVAGFVGQTAGKTQEVINRAMGGVLFIDEAYALTNKENASDFGGEAVEVLLKNMEDHRDDLIVIVAGYTEPMEKFIHSNPGLESRFNKYFFFEDYTGEQLLEILLSMCRKNGYTLSDGGRKWAEEYLKMRYLLRDENFGNARDVRNLFEKALSRQADRVAQMEDPTVEQLMELTREDLCGEEDAAQQEEKPEPAAETAVPGPGKENASARGGGQPARTGRECRQAGDLMRQKTQMPRQGL